MTLAQIVGGPLFYTAFLGTVILFTVTAGGEIREVNKYIDTPKVRAALASDFEATEMTDDDWRSMARRYVR